MCPSPSSNTKEKKKLRRRLLLAGVAVVVCAVVALYFFVDPQSTRFMPQCPFRHLTGFDCPGCGLQRMVHALLHGDFHAAWAANAFMLCALPVLAFLVYVDFRRSSLPRLYAAVNSPIAIIIYTILIVAWGILRNV